MFKIGLCLSIILVVIMLASSCGYVTKSDLLSHINTVTVMRPSNETQEYGLEEDLANALKQEFSRRWGEGSDSIFTAVIKGYDILILGQTNPPDQYRLVIRLSFTFEDIKRNRILKNERNYEKTYDFYVVPGRGKPPETLKEAKQNLIRETAEDIVSSIVDEW